MDEPVPGSNGFETYAAAPPSSPSSQLDNVMMSLGCLPGDPQGLAASAHLFPAVEPSQPNTTNMYMNLKQKIIATDSLIAAFNACNNLCSTQKNEIEKLNAKSGQMENDYQRLIMEHLAENKDREALNSKITLLEKKLSETTLNEQALESHNRQLQELLKEKEIKILDLKSEHNLKKKSIKDNFLAKIEILKDSENHLTKQLSITEKQLDYYYGYLKLIGKKAAAAGILTSEETVVLEKNRQKLNLHSKLPNEELQLDIFEGNKKLDINGPPSCSSIDSGLSSHLSEDTKNSAYNTPISEDVFAAETFSYCNNSCVGDKYIDQCTSPMKCSVRSIATSPMTDNFTLVYGKKEIQNQTHEIDISDEQIEEILNSVRIGNLLSPLPSSDSENDEVEGLSCETSSYNKISQYQEKTPSGLSMNCQNLVDKNQDYLKHLEPFKKEIDDLKRFIIEKLGSFENELLQKQPSMETEKKLYPNNAHTLENSFKNVSTSTISGVNCDNSVISCCDEMQNASMRNVSQTSSVSISPKRASKNKKRKSKEKVIDLDQKSYINSCDNRTTDPENLPYKKKEILEEIENHSCENLCEDILLTNGPSLKLAARLKEFFKRSKKRLRQKSSMKTSNENSLKSVSKIITKKASCITKHPMESKNTRVSHKDIPVESSKCNVLNEFNSLPNLISKSEKSDFKLNRTLKSTSPRVPSKRKRSSQNICEATANSNEFHDECIETSVNFTDKIIENNHISKIDLAEDSLVENQISKNNGSNSSVFETIDEKSQQNTRFKSSTPRSSFKRKKPLLSNIGKSKVLMDSSKLFSESFETSKDLTENSENTNIIKLNHLSDCKNSNDVPLLGASPQKNGETSNTSFESLTHKDLSLNIKDKLETTVGLEKNIIAKNDVSKVDNNLCNLRIGYDPNRAGVISENIIEQKSNKPKPNGGRSIVSYDDITNDKSIGFFEDIVSSCMMSNSNVRKNLSGKVIEASQVCNILIEYLTTDISEESLEKLIEETSHTHSIIIANAIVLFLNEDRPCTGHPIHVPDLPPMPYNQQSCLCFMKKLTKHRPDIFELTMKAIEFKLFNLVGPSFEKNPALLTRYYATLCHVTGQDDKLKLFCADALYCLNYEALTVIDIALNAWPFLLPKAQYKMASDPLVTVMVYLTSNIKEQANISDDNRRKNNLKHVFHYRYGYQIQQFTNENILQLLMQSIKDLNINSNHDSLWIAILLFGKRCGAEWCYKHILLGSLIPLLDDTNTSAEAKEFAIKLLGPLIRPFPPAMRVQCDIIVEKLIAMLKNKEPHKTEEALIYSLLNYYSCKKSCNRALSAIKQWTPQQSISDDLHEALIVMIKQHPPHFWRKKFKINFPNNQR